MIKLVNIQEIQGCLSAIYAILLTFFLQKQNASACKKQSDDLQQIILPL